MGFGQSVKTCIEKCVTYSGRASRSEYWWFILFVFLFEIFVIAGLESVLQAKEHMIEIAEGMIFILLLIPTLALNSRRLHDIGKSGWWQLLNLIPFIGGIILFIWFLRPSMAGKNQYDEIETA